MGARCMRWNQNGVKLYEKGLWWVRYIRYGTKMVSKWMNFSRDVTEMFDIEPNCKVNGPRWGQIVWIDTDMTPKCLRCDLCEMCKMGTRCKICPSYLFLERSIAWKESYLSIKSCLPKRRLFHKRTGIISQLSLCPLLEITNRTR